MDFSRLGAAVNDALFPLLRCLSCGRRLPLRLGLCSACGLKLVPLYALQLIPPKPLSGEVCLYPYEGVAKELIGRFKFRGQFDLPLRRMVPALAARVQEAGFPVELLVPVPSNLPRLHARGYDQVWLLCRALGRQLGLPTCRFALRRRWAGRHQTGLSAEARWRNAAVQYGRGLRTAPVLGKRVLLVDDVTTTGATASACAAVLLALGAEEVYLCCLTKTLDNAPAPAAWPGANHSL